LAKRSNRIDWNEVLQHAVTGARARLQEIKAEMAKILAAFPQLGAEAGGPAVQAQGTAARGRRTRKRMSAAQRKAVGERMQKYWVARREEQAQAKTNARLGGPERKLTDIWSGHPFRLRLSYSPGRETPRHCG